MFDILKIFRFLFFGKVFGESSVVAKRNSVRY